MTRIFRVTVLANLGIYILWFFFPEVEALIYDAETLGILGSSGFDARFDFPVWYSYLWLAYWIVVAYGLFNFFGWSRDALIVGYILTFILAPFHGTVIASPWSANLSMLIQLLDGAIIALAYFSSVGQRFRKTLPDKALH